MFDSSERLTSRLRTQLAPRCLQNWSQIFFEKILIEQETVKCLSDLAGSTVHTYIHVHHTSCMYVCMYFMYIHVCMYIHVMYYMYM